MDVVPELLDEQLPVLNLLCEGENKIRFLFPTIKKAQKTTFFSFFSGVSESVDLCQYEIPEESSKKNSSLLESEVEGKN